MKIYAKNKIIKMFFWSACQFLFRSFFFVVKEFVKHWLFESVRNTDNSIDFVKFCHSWESIYWNLSKWIGRKCAQCFHIISERWRIDRYFHFSEAGKYRVLESFCKTLTIAVPYILIICNPLKLKMTCTANCIGISKSVILI